jgi:hypothetical protein
MNQGIRLLSTINLPCSGFFSGRITTTAVVILSAYLLPLLEFVTQYKYAEAIGFLSWPYDWDSNRYVDTALLYLDALDKGGFRALAEIYQQKPFYSATLLFTGLPFLATTHDITALFASQIIYVLLLNTALLLIIRRLTNSFRWGALAVVAINFLTTGILSGTNANMALEEVRYQLNLPVVALFATMICYVLEGLYTRQHLLWGGGLAAVLLFSFLLRGPMIPLYLLAFGPPLFFLGMGALRLRRWNILKSLIGAAVVSGSIILLHYFIVWPKLIHYVNAAAFSPEGQASFGYDGSIWDRLCYYIDRSVQISWAFPVLLGVILLELPRSVAHPCARFKLVFEEWSAFQSIFTISFLFWVTLVAYIVAAAAPIKNPHFGMPFFVGVWLLGTRSIYKFYATQIDRAKPIEVKALNNIAQIAGVSILLLACIMLARDIRWAHDLASIAEQSRRFKIHQFRRSIDQSIVRFLYDWSSAHSHRKISMKLVNSEYLKVGDIHNIRVGLREISEELPVDVFLSPRPMIKILLVCDSVDPLLGKAIGNVEKLRQLKDPDNLQVELDNYFRFAETRLPNNCVLTFYETKSSDENLQYEWP